jgi:hypothetical protein
MTHLYGPAKEVSYPDAASAMNYLEAIAPESSTVPIVPIRVGRWSLAYSTDGMGLRLLTARILTAGSLESDWVFIGRLAAAFNVPEDVVSEASKSIEADAEATHRWLWRKT